MPTSHLWSQIVAAKGLEGLPERNRLAEAWRETIGAEEVNDLVRVSRTGTTDEKDAAMRVLVGLARKNDVRFSERARKDWLTAANLLLHQEYLKGPAGLIAFRALYDNDFAALVKFLTEEIDLPMALAANHEMLVTHLGDLTRRGAREEVLTRLHEIQAIGGPAGAAAGEMLDRSDSKKQQAKLESLAREWREKRTASLLADLYHGPLGSLLVRGSKRKDLIELLGPPDRKREGMIWYMPSDATALSIEFDKRGKAIGWHMT
jgi:hypothetical protein